jgi:hypothetical protein
MSPTKRKALESLFFDLQRFCESHREWDQLLRESKEQEREHRRFGKSFTRGTARYSQPVNVAVKYFACKCILEPMPLPGSWHAFAAIRRDYQLGQALRELAIESLLQRNPTGHGLWCDLETRWVGLGIDYAEDIAA